MSDIASYKELILADAPLIYLPLDAVDGLTDLSGYGWNGTAAGGVSIGGASGPGDALTATDFDGTDDRVTTSYATRRNGARNPRLLVAGPWQTGGPTLTFGDTTFTPPAGSGVGAGEIVKMVSTGGGTNAFMTENGDSPTTKAMTAAPGDTFRSSIYVRAAAGNAADRNAFASVLWLDSSGAAISESSVGQTLITRGADWVRIGGTTPAAPANTAFVVMRPYGANLTPPAGETYYFCGPLLEPSSAPALGTYFNGTTGPDTAWEGTANASVSSKGVFANGSVRTFEGWANRDTGDTLDMLIGGDQAGTEGVRIYLDAANSNFVFMSRSGSGTSAVWAGAWPGTGQWVHWLVVFDEPNDSAKLYLNGALVSTKALTSPWPTAALSTMQIATRVNNADCFDGKLAHVAVYNGDKSARALDHWSWAISTAASRAPLFGLPSASNFPSPRNLPTGETLGTP